MHSPDRRYWWDGNVWRQAVSPDGRLWFDGAEWRPNPLRPPGRPRVPTRWTRPLQVAVVAVTLLGFGSFVAALPLVASMPIPIDETERQFMVASLVFQAVVFGAAATLIVVGSVGRWRWMFWAVLGVLGLNVVGVLVPLLLGVAGLLPTRPPPGVILLIPRPPHMPMVIGAGGTLAQAAVPGLFVAMLVAGVRIGPWACRRAAAVAPAAGPPADA